MKIDIKKLSLFFKKQDEIILAYLFGSQVRGQTTPLSDVDIGVLIDPNKMENSDLPYGYEAHLLNQISSFLPTEKIDLVLLNDASLLLKHRCAYEGKLLYCKDKKNHIEFKVKTLLEYLDTKPMRDFIKKAFYGKQ